MIKLGISGISGRVGRLILEILQGDDFFVPSIGFGRSEGEICGVKVVSNAVEFVNSCDIIVDFSLPDGLEKVIDANMSAKKPLISGTTGLSDAQMDKLVRLSGSTKVLWDMNMSLGVGIIRGIVGDIGAQLPKAEVEILEKHHNQKKDAPSGTAILLGKEIAGARGVDFKAVASYDRDHKRKDGEIGFASIRAGNIVGEHRVSFFFGDEEIEVCHKAFSRKIFAQGAADGAKKLYSLNVSHGFFSLGDLV
ncbi:4-hydroxy-tetrahydrodipicolinate reductase [Candidatus Deianiraea vastatrix]|uniref:4-hydroxy-tetrahydrodipicolinate reductase n=1 Tax=Candidatus Deianiraea vastatrix TaxID=2163644 RepID=A0A5B8XFB2_9RICK|nr:4-hydroxy-tetrahydrodipicolinate reductase [Candidatus Deianiraea vastatrix]QED23666.1 4-hydroxy-tetrahydrodipicolinate reductase [Candidatus Deianiraea vastatrix]